MNKEIECKTHPDAPHGFLRNASHTQDRLVCECEYWEEPKVNELIRRLLNEATSGLDPDLSKQRTVTLNEMEKFAELIIRECTDLFADQQNMIVNPNKPFAYRTVRALAQHDRDTVRKIREHFGVEE